VTTIVICDPPSLPRRTLAARVAAVALVRRVEVVDDLTGLAESVSSEPVDVVLVGSMFADEPAWRGVLHSLGRARILLLTIGTDPDDVVAGMARGGSGYLARDAAVPELAAALALLTVAEPRDRDGQDRSDAAGSDLTHRELQVLRGMSQGRSNSEIGRALFLSEDTIKTHARRLFRKMRVNDRAHAVAEGFRRGLLH